MIYAVVALAVTLNVTAQTKGQEKTDLNKVITLEREFDPVKKEVVKKAVLPKEIKKSNKETVAPQFSDWTVPTLVPVEIPTMLPYGYRTRHNFSNQRGYLTFGAGTHLNIVTSAGCKVIDREKEQLDLWLQHNSTWVGKNTTKLIEQPSHHQKQRFNDNLVGAVWTRELATGTLGIDGRLHFDSFNFYGGWNDYLRENKTAFFEARADGKWTSDMAVSDADISYEANATLDYAGYDKSHLEGIDGSKEFWFNASVEGEYNLNDNSDLGLLFGGDFMNLRRHNEFSNDVSDKTYGMFTLSPFFKYRNSIFEAKAGVNINLSINDGTVFRLSPSVDLNFKLVKGLNLFVKATGGKSINHLGAMHDYYRYNDPLAQYGNSYVPFDGTVGLNIGPFVGFSAKIFAGYGFETGCVDPVIPAAPIDSWDEALYQDMFLDGPTRYVTSNRFAATIYKMTKWKGAHIGLEANYKYRSLIEAKASFAYAPQGDEDYYEDGTRYKGYVLGNDGPTTVFNLDVTAWPFKPLMVGLGITYRGNRSAFSREWTPGYYDDFDVYHEGYYTYGYIYMRDVVDLHAMARYSFSHAFSVWAQAGNLLCKQWDIMPGHGAQKINLMGGISLNF